MLTLWNDDSLMNRMFDDVMRSALGTSGAATTARPFEPAVDVRDQDDKIVLEFDVPGVKSGDLEITLDNRVLTIKGNRRLQTGDNKQRVLLGRAYGAFSCSYTLPDTVDTEGMTAALADGVLTVSVPKVPQAQPRRIAIGTPAEDKQLGE